MQLRQAGHLLVGRLAGMSRRLSGRERAKLLGMLAAIIGLNAVGWTIVATLPVTHSTGNATTGFGLGVGLTAYVLGMRHAFDSDHIAAIDNTTRKLMADKQRPLTVGFWFSLGHSSVVFGLALLLALGVRRLIGPVTNDGSSLHHYTGLIGTSVSGGFLIIIAVINIVILAGILRVVQAMRHGVFDEETLEAHLDNRGLMNRILRPVMKSIHGPGQMYGVGVLFGLGFDTATEVALLVLATTGAAGGLPWYAILALPLLFAAGMCLFDTIDGTFMNFAYGWAFSRPVRKVFYNLTITLLSVLVAVLIGGLEVLQVLSGQLGLRGGFWSAVGGFDLNTAGFVIVGLFALTWIVALLVWRIARVEARWTSRLQASEDRPVLAAA